MLNLTHIFKKSRIARVLKEIEAPRKAAIAEARLSATEYIANPQYAASSESWEGFDR
jgi:hypothetical protein